jgi:hypothetical protein
MSTVSLDEDEWQKVMSIIATAPWNVANPLLMKIGEQLRRQTVGGLNSGNQMQEAAKEKAKYNEAPKTARS